MSLKSSYKVLKEYRADPIGYIVKKNREEGHRIVMNIFGKKIIILSHPNDVLHVLKSNHSSYTKGRTTKMLRKFLGNGLLTNDDSSWAKQHRLFRPIMGWKSVYDLAPKIEDVTKTFLKEIKESEIDSFVLINKLTWRIVLETLFSQKSSKEWDAWLQDILLIMKIITKKTRTAVPIPFWVPTKDNRNLKRAIKRFNKFIFKMISERRNNEKKNDLLQLMIDAKDNEDKMTDLEIRDEVMTFLMAGHETITNTLSWCMIELANNKGYKKKIEDELSGREFSYEELNGLPWLSAVIDESMRLWPSVWIFMRQAHREDQIDDLKIPVGANVAVSPFLSHRSKDFWERPDEFYPERFLPEEKKKVIPGSYYPYGLGPRGCIGVNFATIEAKIIISEIVKNFDWEILNKKVQEFEAGITLRPTSNTKMNFVRKNV